MSKKYSNLLLYCAGVTNAFEKLAKTIKGVVRQYQRRKHYQHKVAKRGKYK